MRKYKIKKKSARINYLRAAISRVKNFLKNKGIQTQGKGIKQKALIRKYAELNNLTIPKGVKINDWLIDLYLVSKGKKKQSVKLKLQPRESKAELKAKYAKRLRKRATASEIKFRDMALKLKIKFNFQYPINNRKSFYIIDFFIYEGKKCVEIDGGYHNTIKQQSYDAQKDKWLISQGYEVIRITNEQMDKITEDELLDILKVTEYRKVA